MRKRKTFDPLLVEMNGRTIKRIPKKYRAVLWLIEFWGEEITDYLEYKHCKWLQPSERKTFDTILLKEMLKEFIADSKKLIGRVQISQTTEPVTVRKIITRSSTYHAVRFTGGLEIKCAAAIYNASPIKETVRRLY